ncbi:MAG TPA: MATE family efflux transporter [Candidatus Krumholzibacteria bacterium]
MRERAGRILRDLAEAVRGSEQDYTQGAIGRAILLLSVPMVLEMAMESVFAVVDVYFVAHIGPSAVATIGLTESILTLIYAVALGLSIGTTAMVSRRIGEKNPEEAANTAVQAILVGVLMSIPIALVGIFFARDAMRLMGGDEWVIREGFRYTRWMLGGNVVIMLLFILNAVFRGAGDAAIAMRVLWLSNGINIVLGPTLIRGWGPFPEMGVEGAGIATTIGRGTGVLMQFIVLFRGARHIRVLRSHLRARTELMWRLVRVSLGGIGQFVISMSSWIGLVRIMSVFGSDALAGLTIAFRIATFTFLPAYGLSNAAATLVGQNLGAKQPERAERSVWLTGMATMAFMAVVAAVYIIWNEPLVRIFTDDPRVIRVGADCLRIISYGYLFYAWELVGLQAFNGAGDTGTPTRINFVCFYLVQIPLAYLLAMHTPAREHGVYWSVVIAESLAGVIAIMLFRRGRWKTRMV